VFYRLVNQSEPGEFATARIIQRSADRTDRLTSGSLRWFDLDLDLGRSVAPSQRRNGRFDNFARLPHGGETIVATSTCNEEVSGEWDWLDEQTLVTS